MDTLTLNWTRLQTKIFSLLCQRAGEKLSQREIAKILKVSPTAVGNSITGLRNSGLIMVEKIKTINFIFFNRNTPKAIELKRVENLKNITLSGLSDYLRLEFAGGTILLFGSYSKGEDTNTSDIDLAVVGRKEKTLPFEEYERTLQRKINVQYYKSWKDIPEYLKNNILNGIILQGSVEL